jgi:hypothetical protein
MVSMAKEALVDERLDDVEVGAAYVFGRVEGATACEDGEPGEQRLLVVAEESV